MEQLANNCSTAVAAGGYTAASGVLNVDSTAAPWPQTGNFRISIFDKDDDSLKVILKVTAVNSATQFAVTAESVDASADEDDVVRGTMITAGALGAFVGIVPIQAIVAASNLGSFDFQNIPSTFNHLHLRLNCRVSGSVEVTALMMAANADGTAGNYRDSQHLYGESTTVAAGTVAAAATLGGYLIGASSVNALANFPSSILVDVLDYARTTFYKQWYVSAAYALSASIRRQFSNGVWLNTAAISRLTITPTDSRYFIDGSTAILYGVM